MSLSNIKVNNSTVIEVDNEPTAMSENLTKSGGVYRLLLKHPKISFDDSNVDLNIGDEYGNVLFQIKNGHIKTKNFDSENVYVSSIGNKNILFL